MFSWNKNVWNAVPHSLSKCLKLVPRNLCPAPSQPVSSWLYRTGEAVSSGHTKHLLLTTHVTTHKVNSLFLYLFPRGDCLYAYHVAEQGPTAG